MRFRKYCQTHDSLWHSDRYCTQAMLDDVEYRPETECKFERIVLVNERSWRLRTDFHVAPLVASETGA